MRFASDPEALTLIVTGAETFWLFCVIVPAATEETEGMEAAIAEVAVPAPPVRLARAAGDSSDISCRSSGRALFSFFTGMMYSASPSSATWTEVGRENRPPEDMRRKAEPVSSRLRLSCRGGKLF